MTICRIVCGKDKHPSTGSWGGFTQIHQGITEMFVVYRRVWFQTKPYDDVSPHKHTTIKDGSQPSFFATNFHVVKNARRIYVCLQIDGV